jgi:hypothetical protein
MDRRGSSAPHICRFTGRWPALSLAATRQFFWLKGIDIVVLDLDSPTHSSGSDGSLQADFQLAKQAVAAAAVLQGASDGGEVAVSEAYHATLVAPFCLAAAVDFL